VHVNALAVIGGVLLLTAVVGFAVLLVQSFRKKPGQKKV
jgi:hypothetical protein